MKLCSVSADLDETKLGGDFSTYDSRRIYVGLTLDTRVPEPGGGERI